MTQADDEPVRTIEYRTVPVQYEAETNTWVALCPTCGRAAWYRTAEAVASGLGLPYGIRVPVTCEDHR